MSFNIFDYPRNTDITVGYVDPNQGYVTGVSICDANEYAKKNPGTTFIFENRNGIRYLNINEVNQLTPKDLASSAETCTGVEVEGNPDPPQSIFRGGGGIGASGNPVFGRDGSLLAVDLISGGFGYQYPPLVEVRDETGLGVGAVTRSILVGDPDYSDCKFVDTEEVFDQEDDFEEYQICDSIEDVGYGTRYDADGKPIGKWDPKLYATLSRDPIAREIQNYQDFLQKLETPWWTTRKKSPLRVTSGNKTTRIKHDVQHPGWGGEYGQAGSGDFKEVTFNVFTSGAQDKGLALKFTSEDKSHTFKIKANDFKNDETGQKVTQKVKVNTVYNISSEGSFRGKPSEKGLISNLGKDAKEKNPTGKDTIIKGTKIFADFVESSNDNDDLQIEATLGQFTSKQIGKGKGRSNFELKYEFKDSSVFNATKERIDESFMNKYAVSPVPPSNAPGSDFAGQEFTMEWEEDFPYEGEYVFRAQADNLGRFYLDNEKLIETTQFKQDKTPKFIKKTVKSGVHRIRVDLYNQPQYENIIKQLSVPQSNTIDVSFNVRGDGDASFTHNFKINGLGIDVPKPRKTPLNKNVTGKAESGKVYEVEFFVNGSPGGSIKIKNNGLRIEMEDGGGKNPVDASVNVSQGKFFNVRGNKCSFVVGEPIPPAPVLTQSNTSSSQSSTQSDLKTQVKKVFNTIDYIDKADRKLWRIDTRAGKDAAFINQYGILPFDITSPQAQIDGFPGTHVIRWEYIDFPVDGNYNIEVQVDDNVTLYIGNRDGGGRVEIGNGLKDINEGGDEIIIRKRGFSGPGKSTGKSLETRFFKAGKYRIRAELEQINVGPLARNNPMALAINIETAFVEETVISPRSWNENPMGAALIIEAPLPPIPQEPIPPQEGRCPNNPIWTTRFPTSKQKWWPVNFSNQNPNQPSWSRFMNRYAISPIPPLAKKGSDGGGIVYRNEWEVDIPYDGFYAFKSTVDNAGRILVDNQPIMQANYIPINLRNTRGGSGVEQRSGIEAIDGGIIYNWRENNPKAKKIFLTKGKHTIQIEVENGITETFTKIDKKVFSTKDWLYKTPAPLPQSTIIDVNFNFIGNRSAANTHNYKINELGIDIFKPRKTSLNKNVTGKAESGKVYEVEFYNNGSPGGTIIQRSDSFIEYEDGGGNTLDASIRIEKGKFFNIRGNKCSFVVGEQRPPTPTVGGLTSGTARGDVIYEGPTPIANYKGDFISPVLQDVNAKPNEEIQGKDWVFRWSNVDFPVDGQYTLESEADDELKVRIDGVEVGKSKVFEGRRKTTFNATKGKRNVELILSNIRIADTGYEQNPVVGFAQITVPVDVSTGISLPWTSNPVGISAILIPPPCPKKVTGKGVVCRVIVDDPGNGYPASQGPGYPATLRLKSVEVENPGINYSCGFDQIQISPNNGAELDYECDTFGRITKVKVLNPGLGFNVTPEIIIPSDTGVNARFRPQFEVVRDPIVIDPQVIIQVTDLVGLKQTGYVNGRPYYGSVFYKNGVRYAGFYQTPGDLVQVYATLQESIDAKVTTPPSAILRQGTDITSNDPRLNIPGTPDQII